MTDGNKQILLFYSSNPGKVVKRMLRFREAFVSLSRDFDFAVVSYVPTARSASTNIMFGDVEVAIHVYGPDAVDTLDYPRKGARRPFKLIPGNTDLVPLLFWRAHPQYSQYWLLEDDVEYSGDARELFASLLNREGDLLATHLARGFDSWTYSGMLRSPDGCMRPDQSWLVFLPFHRISNDGLRTIDQGYRDGWDGHSEMMWATILKEAGRTIVDVGGNGPYVADQDRNLRYMCQPGKFAFEKLGSFGTMQIRLWPGREKNMLWHPIKEPRAWVRQKTKRWLSIAEWQFDKLSDWLQKRNA